MAEEGIDLDTLFDGMMKSLEESVKAPPWRERRNSGEWPEQSSSELELLDQQLSVQRGGSQAKVEEVYDERRVDMRNVVGERRRRLEAYAGRTRQVIPPEEGKYIVAGRVTDEVSGVGLPNVKVNAFDLDRKEHDYLGKARTDALGYFRIEYTEEDFRDRGEEEQPETYVEVMGEDGQVIHTSTKSFVQKAGEVQFLNVAVDGKSVSRSLDAGQRIDESVKMRIDGLDTRKRMLSTGEAAFVPKRQPAAKKRTVKRSATTKAKAIAGTANTATAVKAETSTTKKQPTTKRATTQATKKRATTKKTRTKAKRKTAAKAKARKPDRKIETTATSKATAKKTAAAKASRSKKRRS